MAAPPVEAETEAAVLSLLVEAAAVVVLAEVLVAATRTLDVSSSSSSELVDDVVLRVLDLEETRGVGVDLALASPLEGPKLAAPEVLARTSNTALVLAHTKWPTVFWLTTLYI